MRCMRVYASPDRESHFDEVELPTKKMSVHPDATPFDVFVSYHASRVRLTRIPAGMRAICRPRSSSGQAVGPVVERLQSA
jgi:hypothetical protein